MDKMFPKGIPQKEGINIVTLRNLFRQRSKNLGKPKQNYFPPC